MCQKFWVSFSRLGKLFFQYLSNVLVVVLSRTL
jgi:hypothetical protein